MARNLTSQPTQQPRDNFLPLNFNFDKIDKNKNKKTRESDIFSVRGNNI